MTDEKRTEGPRAVTDRAQAIEKGIAALADTDRERRLMRYAAVEGVEALWRAVVIDGERIEDAAQQIVRALRGAQ